MKKVKQYDLALLDDEKEVVNISKNGNDVLDAYPVENQNAQPPIQGNFYQPQPQQFNQYPNQYQSGQYPNGYYPNQPVNNNYYPNQPINNNYYQQPNNQPYGQQMYNEVYNQPQGNYTAFNPQGFNAATQQAYQQNSQINQQSTLLNNQNGFNQQKDAESEKDFLVKQALVKNPFLFDDFPENKYINSIEDFFVTYKKEEYKIGDLVRKKDVKKGKKKKIFKECFKDWKEEVEKRLEDDALIGAGQFDNSEKTKTEIVKVKFWPYFLTIITLILASILMAGKVSIMAVGDTSHGEVFAKFATIETVCYNIIIPVAIGIIILCIILNIQSSSFGKVNKYAKNQYKRKLADIRKKFNKKYSSTMSYYSNSYKGNFKKDPLSISKTAIGTQTFMEVENLVASTSQRTTIENKNNGSYKFVRSVIRLLVFITFFFTTADTLTHLVISLFNMIFNKSK